jgi:hypothetical protein
MLGDEYARLSQDVERESILNSIIVKPDHSVNNSINIHNTIYEIQIENEVKNNKKEKEIEEYYDIHDIGERSD